LNALTADAPRIVFPCDYPIKVMGYAHDDFQGHVLTVMARHAPGFDQTSVRIRDSRNGRFQSITVTITATGTEQLQAIFEDLKTSELVQMVL